MSTPNMLDYSRAVRDFRRARQKAAMQEIIARLRGERVELLSFDDVRRKLHGTSSAPRGLREIPLDSIVGSVGRYADFTRSFLPRGEAARDRWSRVKAMTEGLEGLPPIEVFQVGEVYFVKDGHHRVSVAREVGASTIEAYVTEVRTKVPLSPSAHPDELILKSEYTQFLERTGLDRLRPQAQIELTVPGKYEVLLEHVAVHRYFMGMEQQREIAYEAAVAHWFDHVYSPVVGVIRQQGILRDFPGRTEADLYLWLMEHRAELEAALGWKVEPQQAAADLAAEHSPLPERRVSRLGGKIRNALVPDELEPGPPPGAWRRERVERRTTQRLFTDVLVAVRGDEHGWQAVEQALYVARQESGRVLGLHVVESEAQLHGQPVEAMRQAFERRCEELEIPGRFVVEAGSVARTISDRARWADLVVMSLAHPPASLGVGRPSSGLRTLIRRCPRPILTVPGAATGLARPLLAYDNTDKAQEALFVAAYLAAAWQTSLAVVSVSEENQDAGANLHRAKSYLRRRGVTSQLLRRQGDVAQAVLEEAQAGKSDLIVMGGYGASPVVEVVLGSTVDEVLRRADVPMLICR